MIWVAIVIATAGAFLLKLAGFLVPAHIMEKPRFNFVASVLPIGLLAGLVSVQIFATKQSWTFDGRIAGALVAVALLMYKRSFIVVVLSAAIVTAIGRHFGLWA